MPGYHSYSLDSIENSNSLLYNCRCLILFKEVSLPPNCKGSMMPWNVWLSTEMIIHHVLHSSLCKRLLNRSDYYVMLAFLDFRTTFQIGSLTFCCTFPSRKLEILTFRVEWNAALAPIMQDEVRNAFIQMVLRQLGQGGGSHPPCVSALMEISTINCIPSQPFVAEQDLFSAPSCVSHSLKLWRNKKGNQKPTSKTLWNRGTSDSQSDTSQSTYGENLWWLQTHNKIH